MADNCPLCKNPFSGAGQHPNKDMLYFECHTCGRYYIDMLAIPVAQGIDEESLYRLINGIRAASESGHVLEIMADDIPNIVESSPRWRSLAEGVDRLLLLLAERASTFFSTIDIQKARDYPLVWAHGESEMNSLLVAASKLGFLEPTSEPQLTIQGWYRIDELRSEQPDSRQAFVAMWFHESLDPIWEYGFKVGIEKSQYFHAVRVDAVQHNERIDDRVIAEIRRSGLVVADFTGNRGGVYFEAGYARGFGIPVIWTCRKAHAHELHFDTRQFNHILWENASELAGLLNDRISATVLPKGWHTA